MNKLRILFLGDIVGISGRVIFQKHIGRLKRELEIDAVVVNGENSADGRGITPKVVSFFKHNGVDVVTTGNHIWHHKEIYSYLDSNTDVIRPANYPSGCPGKGSTMISVKGHIIAIINVQGRTFMKDELECPFRASDSLLTYLRTKTNLIFVDFHAETTSEKAALAFYLDGRISGLVGTHTHVQTADERILPKGTAFITDLGMAGAMNSSLGMKKDAILYNFLQQMPVKFTVETTGPMMMSGAWIDVDTATGKALDIQRIRIVDNDIILDNEKD